MTKTVISIILTLFTVFSLHAQTGEISGTVTAAQDHQPLIGVTVFSGKYGTKTNANGQYKLNLPLGEQSLSISYTGFKTQIQQVTISSKEQKRY